MALPYPRAPYFVAALLPLVAVAFWPFYFSRLAEAPFAQHVHAVTATAWMLLLVLQGWAIHHRRIALHRTAGKASLVIIPLFLIGTLMALHALARGTAAGANPFVDRFGPGLGAADFLAAFAFGVLVFGALRHRRNVQLHARYMLATPLLLLAPIVARLLERFVPIFTVQGPHDFERFVYSVQLANVMTLAVALGLYATAPRFGRPFLFVAVVVVLQMLSFQWLGVASWWREAYAALGSLPVTVPVVIGLGAGLAIIWRAITIAPPGGRERTLAEPVA